MDREVRSLIERPEIRAASDGPGRLVGYAAVFGDTVDIGGHFREVFKPGAFDGALNADIRALVGHDESKVIGRTAAGTLVLRQDSRGLAFEVELPDTGEGRDLAVLVKRGDITGMSVGMVVTRQEWDDTGEIPTRTILAADLFEISAVAFPAYDGTSIAMRSLDAARKDRRQQNFSAAARRLQMKATLDLRTRSKAQG